MSQDRTLSPSELVEMVALREALTEIHAWAKAYDWYYCDGDVENELPALRTRIEGLLKNA